MADYTTLDKLAALISLFDDGNESENKENKIIIRDKFNKTISNNQSSENLKKNDDCKLENFDKFVPNEADDEVCAVDEIDEDFSDEDVAEMMPIYQASNEMYIQHKAKYSKQSNPIKIEPPNSKRSQYEIDNKLNLFSHEISVDLLRMIFGFAINPKDSSDFDTKYIKDIDLHPRRLPITLLKVCKNWRLCIMKTDSFWQPVMDYVIWDCGKEGMTWKKLITVPDKYLNQFATNFFVARMDKYERNKFSQLTGEKLEDPDSFWFTDMDINMFLLIQCLKRCRNVYSLYLSGTLCEDIFYAIGKYCNNLRSLDMPFVQSGNPHWFSYLVKEGNKCKNTLCEIRCEQIYWINDECMKYFGQLCNLESIEMDRLHSVSTKGLSYLFDGDRQTVMKNISLTCGIRFEQGTIEFMKLMLKNGQEMLRLHLTECQGVNDAMLKLLEDKEALPNLKEIDVSHTSCTSRAVNELRKKRPDINVEFYSEEESSEYYFDQFDE